MRFKEMHLEVTGIDNLSKEQQDLIKKIVKEKVEPVVQEAFYKNLVLGIRVTYDNLMQMAKEKGFIN